MWRVLGVAGQTGVVMKFVSLPGDTGDKEPGHLLQAPTPSRLACMEGHTLALSEQWHRGEDMTGAGQA